MTWKKRKKLQGAKRNYNLSRKLRKERKITEEFELMLSSLSLEELIGLKLELAANAVDNRLFGLALWHGMPFIVREAVFKYAVSATRTKVECMNFLGLKQKHYYDLWKTYQIESFFSEEGEED